MSYPWSDRWDDEDRYSRPATQAEAQAEMRRNWDGLRCDHGWPVGAPGPDDPCAHCEREMGEEALADWEPSEPLDLPPFRWPGAAERDERDEDLPF